MEIEVVLNPRAGDGDAADSVERAARERGWSVRRTETAEDAPRFAAEAARRGVDRVVAAGGDGTVHGVAQGLCEVGPGAALAVLPLGTGNDLSRTLALPGAREAQLDCIAEGAPRDLDVALARAGDASLWVVNALTGGFSGEVDEVLDGDTKSSWGPLSYVRGAAEVLRELPRFRTRVELDDATVDEEVVNVMVANGRFAGGGIGIAPTADPEDGLLDVVIVRSGSVAQLAVVAAQMVAGEALGHELVAHHLTRRVAIRAEPGMWLSADGELWANEPAVVEVAPGRLPVVVGPAYARDPRSG